MEWTQLVSEHWHIKLVSVVLIWAAWIDGRQLRVPNWMTYPLVFTGLIYGFCAGGWDGHPVAVREGNVLLCAFHPEITGEGRVHSLLMAMATAARERVAEEAGG